MFSLCFFTNITIEYSGTGVTSLDVHGSYYSPLVAAVVVFFGRVLSMVAVVTTHCVDDVIQHHHAHVASGKKNMSLTEFGGGGEGDVQKNWSGLWVKPKKKCL